MADKRLVARVWAEIRLWLPSQSDRIVADKAMLRGMMGFLGSLPDLHLARAWARVKARPRVYASDSIPALLTQALGDEAADTIAGPEDFDLWVKDELQQGSRRVIEAPTPLHAEAIKACGGWYDLGMASAKDLEWRLKPGRLVFERAREHARLESAVNPGSIALPDAPHLLLVGDE